MRHYLWVTSLVALAAPAPVPAQTYGIVGVTVVPMDRDRVVPDQTVIVRDGIIAAMSATDRTDVPQDAERIDGRGKFLMPGLAEMHGHVPGGNAPPAYTEAVLFLYVANGVTTVRGMQGHPAQLALRDRIARRELLAPRLYVSSPAMTGNGVQTADQAERLVREYHAAGYDHLKVHEGLTAEVYDAIARTARELGIPFAGHVTNAITAFDAMVSGQASIDHLDNMLEAIEFSDARIPELVEAAVRANTGVVPTEVLWETAFLAPPPADRLRADRTELRYMPRQQVESWVRQQEQSRANASDPAEARRIIALRRRLIAALYDGGALLLLGTDSPQRFSVPGFSIHREMQVMVEAGLSPYAVLVTGTRHIARYFGTEEETGTVAVGKRADLLLLEANPLEDVANVGRRAGVMVNGRWLPEREIEERLARMATTN